jgi:hypothetical protein
LTCFQAYKRALISHFSDTVNNLPLQIEVD